MPDAQELRGYALAMPEAEEVETWGHPTFRVRGKIFATLDADGEHGGVKTTKLEQVALVSSEPNTFAVPAYVGRYGWVQVRLDAVDSDHLQELIIDAWRQTAPKRLVREFDATN